MPIVIISFPAKARCYLEDLATSIGVGEENCSRILTEYDNFMNSYQSLSSGDNLSEGNYPFLARTAKRILSCNSNSMSCERCFPIMSWLNFSRRNRMNLDNLTCYTKAYLLLRSKGAKRDEQEIDDKKMFFYENLQSEEEEIENWYPSDASDIFEKVSSIFATSSDFRSFPGKSCNDQTGDFGFFTEVM